MLKEIQMLYSLQDYMHSLCTELEVKLKDKTVKFSEFKWEYTGIIRELYIDSFGDCRVEVFVESVGRLFILYAKDIHE